MANKLTNTNKKEQETRITKQKVGFFSRKQTGSLESLGEISNYQKYKKYFTKYNKYYYLKKLLEDPDYNKKRWAKEKSKKIVNGETKTN